MLRSLFARLSPSLFKKIEAESRVWMMRCQRCHHEISVWDYGGLRYKALGPVWRLGRCASCRRLGMMKVYRRPAGEDS